MIKILQVLPTLNVCGGVENYLMNYYANMDLTDMQIDFCVHSLKDSYFKNLIESRGGKIHILPKFSLKNYSAIKKGIKKLFKENKYDIVHCHQANAAYFYFKTAKKCGIKCRILHSHQTKAADKLTHALRNKPLLHLGKKYSTDFFACSKLAGDYLFGKKKYEVIVNAVDVDKFSFSEEPRNKIREKYSVPQSAFVIGHIGRLCPQKNQSFLIDVFNKIAEVKDDAYLFLVGEGEDRQKLEKKVTDYGLEGKAILTGATDRTFEFYSAFDVFVLPSLYEGLPVVGVEAQCNGLPLITSTNVTEELNLTDSVEFLPIKRGAEIWAKAVLNLPLTNDRCEAFKEITEAGYDIKQAQTHLENLYVELYKRYYD